MALEVGATRIFEVALVPSEIYAYDVEGLPNVGDPHPWFNEWIACDKPWAIELIGKGRFLVTVPYAEN